MAQRTSRPLKAEQLVADSTGRRLGRVTLGLGRDRYRVTWDDGETTVERRSGLLVRYTTTTPTRTAK
jgi:hypothetical protein